MNVYIRSVFHSGVVVFQVTTHENSRFMDPGQVETVTKSKCGSVHREGISVEYEITVGHCVSPPGNRTQGNDLEGDSAVRRLTHYKSNCSS